MGQFHEVSSHNWSNIDRQWLFALSGKNRVYSLLLLRFTQVAQIYVLPEKVWLFQNHLERSFYSRRPFESCAQDFIPVDNSRQSAWYPVAVKLSVNKKAGDD